LSVLTGQPTDPLDPSDEMIECGQGANLPGLGRRGLPVLLPGAAIQGRRAQDAPKLSQPDLTVRKGLDGVHEQGDALRLAGMHAHMPTTHTLFPSGSSRNGCGGLYVCSMSRFTGLVNMGECVGTRRMVRGAFLHAPVWASSNGTGWLYGYQIRLQEGAPGRRRVVDDSDLEGSGVRLGAIGRCAWGETEICVARIALLKFCADPVAVQHTLPVQRDKWST
jgi:hypothetical protein